MIMITKAMDVGAEQLQIFDENYPGSHKFY